jgi:hypothetical protein
MGFLAFQSGGGAVVLPLSLAAPGEVLRWSDRATWSGRPPTPEDIVRVPAGRTLVIDRNIHVAALEIAGRVSFARRDLAVRSGGILVHAQGVLSAGEPEQPFEHRLSITLEGAREREMIHGLGSKFLAAIDGGRIELIGRRRRSWAMLAVTASPGAIVVRVGQPVDWRRGERIAIASGGPDLPLIEERSVFNVSADGVHVTLDRPVQHRHLGENSPVYGALPGSIGRVALLSRDLVVEGDEDSARTGYGAHCLVAGRMPGDCGMETGQRGSVGRFQGVEFRRMGQFNRLGRYPLHWHHNGEAADSMLVDSIVHQSFQRGVVVSGTRRLRLQGNTMYKPLGHGFITDEADAGAGIITANLTIRPRVVRFADPAMRALSEHKPRAVWFLGAARPRTLNNAELAGADGRPRTLNGLTPPTGAAHRV